MIRGAAAARKAIVVASALALAGQVVYVQAAGANGPKPLLAGLVERHDAVAAKPAFRNVVNAGVISVNWSEIQRSQGADLDTTVIDDGIRRAKNANGRVKLKVYAGRYAPTWAKTLDGAPYCLYDPPDTDSCYSMPRFWTPNFKAAYDTLLTKLADKYEADETVATLQLSRCTTMTAEPFQRQAGSGPNRKALRLAGFTVDKDETCLKEQLESHAAIWPRTRADLALHPYQRVKSDSAFTRDQDFTRSIMEHCRKVLGTKCVLGHTSLGKNYPAGSPEAVMYTDMARFGAPIWMQTATLQKLGGTCADLVDAIAEGDRRGASTVELPISYDKKCTLERLTPGDTALEANPQG